MIVEKSTKDAQRWWDVAALFFLLALITTVAVRLAATRWTDSLDRLENLVLYAFLLGAWLAYSRFKRGYFLPIGLIYGLISVFFVLIQVYTSSGSWLIRTAMVAARIRFAWEQLNAGQSVSDPILFTFPVGLVLWWFTYLSTWLLVRNGSAWFCCTAGSALILVIDRYSLYSEHRAVYYILFMLFCLLLLSRIHLLRQKMRWLAEGTIRGESAVADITRAAILSVLGLVAVVWILPVLASPSSPILEMWRSMSKPWESVRSQAANAFAPLQGNSSNRMLFSADNLSLGNEISQEDIPVLKITVDLPNPQTFRYYWRARSYDTYANGVWSNQHESTYPFTSQVETASLQDWSNRFQIHFNVLVQSDNLATLYTEQDPHGINIPTRAYGQTLEDGKLDLNRLEPDTLLRKNEVYWFDSARSDVAISDLQQSTSDYPEWITANYLQIPAQLTPQLTKLAAQITASAASPYEKTAAITRYLRSNYVYQPKVAAAPLNLDPVDYFLFDTKEGFCTYYATSEVLLLRAVGVPARLVVGFAQGEYDNTSKSYQVQLKDLHAWPEVFFTENGWVAFEPTVLYESVLLPDVVDPQRAALEEEERLRRQRIQASDADILAGQQAAAASTAQPDAARKSRNNQSHWLISVLLAAILALVGLSMALRRQRVLLPVWIESTLVERGHIPPGWLSRWAAFESAAPMDRYYRLLSAAFGLVGCPPRTGDTPAERLLRWQDALPQLANDAEEFIRDYELDRYSQHTIHIDRAKSNTWGMIKQIFADSIRKLLHR